jgi:hypothetical protein
MLILVHTSFPAFLILSLAQRRYFNTTNPGPRIAGRSWIKDHGYLHREETKGSNLCWERLQRLGVNMPLLLLASCNRSSQNIYFVT